MAEYPEDRAYTTDHEWVTTGNDSIARVGITDFAAEALGDVVFASMPELGDEVAAGDCVAELESTKSVSEVFTPVSGIISRINEAVVEEPEMITSDPYDTGWLFEVEMSDQAELEDLLDAEAYADHVDKADKE